MNKKGALELSMNTIIIIVIGVVILSLGLMFVRGIFVKVGTLSDSAFESAENELNTISSRNQEVTIPSLINVKQGEQKTFRVWVVNQGDTAKPYTLSIAGNNGISFLIPSASTTLGVGNEVGYVVGVSVPKNTPKGLYDFTANIEGAEINPGFIIDVE